MNRRVISLLVVFLLLSTMACAVLGGSDEDAADDPAAEELEDANAGEDASPPEEEQDASAALDQLGDVFESPQGGFSFRQVAGYEALDFFGMVAMTPPGADPNTGPVITLIGAPNESGLDVQALLDEMMTGMPGEVQIEDAYPMTVGGTDGMAADFSGSQDGVSVAGRFVVAAPSNGQTFNMISIFPADAYGEAEKALLDAVLSTVQFFEPEAMDFGEGWEEVGEGEGWDDTWTGDMLRQWAISAEASSEYGSDSWSASQVAGAPDTTGCGDYSTAWASATSYGQDWVELNYATPVVPKEINIYQTYSPNQVVWVEVRDMDGIYNTVYFDAPYVADCPFVMTIPISDVDFPIDGVRVNMDQSVLETSWNEIDAVELVGYP